MEPRDLSQSSSALRSLSSTGGAGGVLDVFYERWKLKVVVVYGGVCLLKVKATNKSYVCSCVLVCACASPR